MSFSPEQNYWFIPQNKLKIPQEFEVHFWWCPVIYREFALENARDVFLLSHRHALLQRATSDLKKFFLIWSSSNAIATPWCFASVLGSHGCWLWSQDCMVWPILTAATSHRPHLCKLNSSVSNSFLYAKHPFRVVASFMAPTKLVT